jgi:hypothetical protein
MKRYLAIRALAASVVAVVGLGSSAAGARELPKRFWGEWIPIDSSPYPINMKLSSTAITFGQPPPTLI